MRDVFPIVDLVSQAAAVQRHIKGWPTQDKLDWLAARGRLTAIVIRQRGAPPTFEFESGVGLHCVFFLSGDQIVFLGDQTTFVTSE
jgi:hypothetical protein